MGQGECSLMREEACMVWISHQRKVHPGFFIISCRCGTEGKREGWGLKDVSSPTSKNGVRLFITWRHPTFISCSCYLSITVRVGALVHDIFTLDCLSNRYLGHCQSLQWTKRKKKEERKNSPTHTKLYSFCPEVSCVTVLIFHWSNWVTCLCRMQRGEESTIYHVFRRGKNQKYLMNHTVVYHKWILKDERKFDRWWKNTVETQGIRWTEMWRGGWLAQPENVWNEHMEDEVRKKDWV